MTAQKSKPLPISKTGWSRLTSMLVVMLLKFWSPINAIAQTKSLRAKEGRCLLSNTDFSFSRLVLRPVWTSMRCSRILQRWSLGRNYHKALLQTELTVGVLELAAVIITAANPRILEWVLVTKKKILKRRRIVDAVIDWLQFKYIDLV